MRFSHAVFRYVFKTFLKTARAIYIGENQSIVANALLAVAFTLLVLRLPCVIHMCCI